ncbi:S8 family serine peptidase [Halovivax limisalsi]|uniref:S8 family serine peptidase n=1 Tax=Halovivax limisalsi TaxID=1453760 RepID=UPI001FFC6080|nr:S8 family serine peptidase [Halovivax limisalsi]
MTPKRLIALVLAVLVLGTVFAPLGAASPTTLDPQATEPADVADATAQIDDSLFDESGETDLFLYLPDVGEATRQTDPEAVESALKSIAERTQGPVLDALDEYDSVTVEDTFWIRNSVLVTADLDAVDLETLAAIDGVERIEPHVSVPAPEPVEATSVAHSQDDHVTWGLDAINAPDVWGEFGVTGEGARVVVADTGVDADHPDIDLADEDGWIDLVGDADDPVDDSGHGTHVSGTLVGGNATGTAIGVAPDAELGVARVCEVDGCPLDAILGSIEWAVETDADVINLAIPGSVTGDTVDAVYNAMDAGTLVVASIGGDGEGTVASPGAGYDSIGVGATDEDGGVADFSGGDRLDEGDFGGNWMDHWPEESYVAPDVVAPGVYVLSAQPGGEYEEFSGTSMAAAHVAGAAATIRSADPTVDSWAIRELLAQTAWKPDDWDPTEAQYHDPETGHDSRYGVGSIDLHAAVSRVTEPDPPTERFLRLGNATAAEGDTATVSLDTDLEGIAGYQARIDYDPSVVSFVEASGVDINDPTVNDENGTLTLSASQAQGVDAPTLAEVTFEAVGSAGDATDLVFDTEFTRLYTEDSMVEPAEYLDGSIAVGESACELPGDVDGDGQVTSIDATKTQQHIVGMDPGTFNEACADLNGDGEITPADVTRIQQIIVGIGS